MNKLPIIITSLFTIFTIVDCILYTKVPYWFKLEHNVTWRQFVPWSGIYMYIKYKKRKK